MEDLGIYTNIRKSGNKSPWDKQHKMYYADCKVCGKTVERTLYDLRHFNKKCRHNKNDIPKNFLSNDYDKRVYDLWRNMMMRATEKFWEKYPTYKGTSISEEWRNFMTFYEDIKDLDGYQMWKDGKGKYIMLDKDVLGNGKKLYSKETCCFLSHADSNRDVHKRNPDNIKKFREAGAKYRDTQKRKIKAINEKTKEEYNFDSIKECGRILNLNTRNIFMCLSKEEKYKSHQSCKGWVFEEL